MSQSNIVDFGTLCSQFNQTVKHCFGRMDRLECEKCTSLVKPTNILRHIFADHKEISVHARGAFSIRYEKILFCRCRRTWYAYGIVDFLNHLWQCCGVRVKMSPKLYNMLINFPTTKTGNICSRLIKQRGSEPIAQCEKKNAEIDMCVSGQDEDIILPIDEKILREEASAAIIDPMEDDEIEEVLAMEKVEQHYKLDVEEWDERYQKRNHRLEQNLRRITTAYVVTNNHSCKIRCRFCSSDRYPAPCQVMEHYNRHNLHQTDSVRYCYHCEVAVFNGCEYVSGNELAKYYAHVADCLTRHCNRANWNAFKTEFAYHCREASVIVPFELKSEEMFTKIGDTKPIFTKEEIQSLYALDSPSHSFEEMEDILRTMRQRETILTNERSIHNCKNCDEEVLENILAEAKQMKQTDINDFMSSAEFLRNCGSPPKWVLGRKRDDEDYCEIFNDEVGLKLWMVELAKQCSKVRMFAFNKDQTGTQIIMIHMSLYRITARPTLTYFFSKPKDIWVTPVSCLCSNTVAFDRINDRCDLLNTHRHVVVVFRNIRVYRAFMEETFKVPYKYRTATERLLDTQKEHVQIFFMKSRTIKELIKPRQLFNVLYKISRPTYENETSMFPNKKNYFDGYRMKQQDSPMSRTLIYDGYPIDDWNGRLRLDSEKFQVCGNNMDETLSLRESITQSVTRHFRPLFYGLYEEGLSDWMDRIDLQNQTDFVMLMSKAVRTNLPFGSRTNDFEQQKTVRYMIQMNNIIPFLPRYIDQHHVAMQKITLENKSRMTWNINRLYQCGCTLKLEDSRLNVFADYSDTWVVIPDSFKPKLTKMLPLLDACMSKIHHLEKECSRQILINKGLHSHYDKLPNHEADHNELLSLVDNMMKKQFRMSTRIEGLNEQLEEHLQTIREMKLSATNDASLSLEKRRLMMSKEMMTHKKLLNMKLNELERQQKERVDDRSILLEPYAKACVKERKRLRETINDQEEEIASLKRRLEESEAERMLMAVQLQSTRKSYTEYVGHCEETFTEEDLAEFDEYIQALTTE